MFLLGMLFKENTLFLEHCTLLVAYKTLISSITIHSVLFFSQTCECIYYNTKNNVHPNNNNKQEKGNIKEITLLSPDRAESMHLRHLLQISILYSA